MNVMKKLTRERRVIELLAVPLFLGLLGTQAFAEETIWKEVQVPIGGDKFITVQGPPRIAYFPAGGGNGYMAASADELEKRVALIPGATLATLDANWDPLKQLSMIQNAIASGQYNAFILDSLDDASQCKAVTEDAPAANIAVVTVSAALCGLHLKPDARDALADGLIGGIFNNSINSIYDVLSTAVEGSPGPQKVLVLTGPALHSLSPQIDGALAMIAKEHPEFEIVANVKTNFSTIDSFNKTLPVLTAHPEITVIFTAFADITQGALKAVAQAGMEDKIKVYEQLGTQASIEAVKAGKLFSTSGNYPRSGRAAAVNMIAKAFAGEPFDRVVLGDGGPVPEDIDNWSGASIFTPENIDDYKTEF